MSKPGFFQNIKLTVFIGYLLLFLLTLFGGIELFRQLVSFSNKDRTFKESKQLTLISNTLISLYETESTRKVMLSNDFRGDLLIAQYDAHNAKVHLYLDSLYKSSTDLLIHHSLDTVKLLLSAKEVNMKNMLLLTDSIRKLPYSKKIITTVLSRKDIDGLTAFLKKNISRIVSDSSFYEKKKKKGFLSKLKDAFTDAQDSTKVIAKQNVLSKDSVIEKPINLLTDTVMQYVNDFSTKSDKKKALYLAKLSTRQEDMLYYDEMLTNQIHLILRDLETKERKFGLQLISDKEKAIKKSTHWVSAISFLALFTLILFMMLSLSLINKSQDFRNKLEKSKQIAEALSKSRERLLLMISHDIKAPLSSIIGHIELLSKEKMPETEKSYIDNMRNSSEHILELVNKLMDYHKLEQGKSEVNKMIFSPHDLVNNIYAAFIPATENKGLKYTLKNNIDTKLSLQSDPYIIRQILNNLISNAIKFTTKGSIQITSSLDNDGRMQVMVKDTGFGIKPEDREKIFGEFQRLGNAEQQRDIDGFGLGLAITYKLVGLLNGNIQLESEFGKGTQFTVSIPLQNLDGKANIYLPVENATTQRTGRIKAKILFIDDDVTMLNVHHKLLAYEGADVTICSDSKKVLPILEKNKFDIVLTDIQMPQMNGFELIKKIRSKKGDYYKNLPVIALSARSDISEENFITAGFTTFMPKPVSFESLISKIYEITNAKKNNNTVKQTPAPENKGIHSIIAFVEDDRETALDILNVFSDENNVKIKELTESLKTNNWNQIKTTAHKLSPLMKMIGADEIANICLDLEKGEKNEDKVKKLIELVQNKNKEIAEFIKNKYPELKA